MNQEIEGAITAHIESMIAIAEAIHVDSGKAITDDCGNSIFSVTKGLSVLSDRLYRIELQLGRIANIMENIE